MINGLVITTSSAMIVRVYWPFESCTVFSTVGVAQRTFHNEFTLYVRDSIWTIQQCCLSADGDRGTCWVGIDGKVVSMDVFNIGWENGNGGTYLFSYTSLRIGFCNTDFSRPCF